MSADDADAAAGDAPGIVELWAQYRRAAAALAWCDAVGYGPDMASDDGGLCQWATAPGGEYVTTFGNADGAHVAGIAAMVAAAAAALACDLLDYQAYTERGGADSLAPDDAAPEPLDDGNGPWRAALYATADRCDAAAALARSAADDAAAACAAAFGHDVAAADLGLIVASTLWPSTMTDLHTRRRGARVARRFGYQVRNADDGKEAAVMARKIDNAGRALRAERRAADDPTDGAP